MTQHEEKLRHTFQAHESLAPDPAEVYARVQQLSRTYRWRRRGAQAAGVAVLGAGLFTGAITVPAMLPGDTPSAVPAAAPAVSAPAPVVSYSTAQELDAFFAAGYDLAAAEQLARIWQSPGDLGTVKAEAGRRLLAGEPLPVRPDPTVVVSAQETRRVEAFFAAGYDYQDAVKLARLWKSADPYHAKIEGGKRLLAGRTLPIKP
ncbi:hypothetical protein ACWKSP_29955 [Micromonosporaceae bacterium Da 78-11]